MESDVDDKEKERGDNLIDFTKTEYPLPGEEEAGTTVGRKAYVKQSGRHPPASEKSG